MVGVAGEEHQRAWLSRMPSQQARADSMRSSSGALRSTIRMRVSSPITAMQSPADFTSGAGRLCTKRSYMAIPSESVMVEKSAA